jgi:hypothetical protein
MQNFEVYEIPNTFTNDFPLDKQIQLGINDWIAEMLNGRVGFGHTKDEAITNLLGE